MMLMTEPAQLRATLADIRPTHVAVAYLGYGWSDYLDVTALEEIVVSPTLGSFPYALDDLLDAADRHGIAVYFQPDLHAKLFIGNDSCLIGSANLSRNGFSGGLREAGVHLQDPDSVQQAQAVFETLKAGAVTSPDKQRAMVSELVETWQRARRHGVLPNEDGDRPAGTILDWKPGVERVQMAWFDAKVDISLNETSIRQQLPEIGHHQPQDYFEDYASLVERDDVKAGDWLILWAAKGDGTPDQRSSPYWLRVDRLISEAADASEAPYTQLAVTLSDSKAVTPPFELDERAKRLIKQLLVSGDYPALLWSEAREPWRFKDAREDNQRFLADLQQAYRDEAVSD
ncbi:phospholipase D family protein [Salinicola sp. LHM]|uniref:phospholipase D family protein n=1 Tax=Salinicola sp. LHM TaxID=3065298 RepID=UPI002ACECBA5|nr:phospholipase D family protein [Salinicola sp. LHM]WQH34204.1 phospholipase D family protein [Salinicola sp. LHM]